MKVMCRICENKFNVIKLGKHLKLCQGMVNIKKRFLELDKALKTINDRANQLYR